jgi:hypothetical protein
MRIMPNDELCRVDWTSHVKDKRIYPAIRHNQKGFDRSRFDKADGLFKAFRGPTGTMTWQPFAANANADRPRDVVWSPTALAQR